MSHQFHRGRSGRRSRLALLASALIVVAACGPAPSTPDPGTSQTPSTTQLPSPPGSPAAVGPSPSAEPSTEGPPPSETLIAAALAAGTITYEQSLLYRALALFGSPGLPEEFRSPISDIGAATALLKEIDQKEAELSAGLLEQLAPYRVRPADPVSIFNNPPGQGSLGMVLALATPPPTWVSRSVDGTGAQVWVKASPDADAQLTAFAGVVAKVWAELPGVFRYPEPDKPGVPNLSINPDSAIDVYFVDIGAIKPRRAACAADPADPSCIFQDTYGYTSPADEYRGTTSSGFLVLNAAQAGDQLVDTVAHELTHAGQNAYDWKESDWLAESTATWAAYRVMQKLNLLPAYAYDYLPEFFAELSLPLAQLGQHPAQHEYRSWLFFLFASMEKGDAIVTKVWEAAAAEGVQSEKAVDQAFPFDKHFADFSVRNWNQGPVTPRYKDVAPAPFPAGLRPKISQGGPAVMIGASESLLAEPVRPLASRYYAYQFKDAVRKVIFENAFAGVAHAHVWAIKKIRDTWAEPEDWTGDAKKEFCRDGAAQDLTELVLIVSDSDMRADVAAPATRVVAQTTGCVGWIGEIRGEGSYSTLGVSTDWQETSVAQVNFIANPWGSGVDPEFVLGSATVTWTSQWIHPPTDMSKHDNPPSLCPTTLFSGSYQATAYDKATLDGDGELSFRPPPDGAPTPGPGATRYAQLRYEAGGISRIPYIPCQQHGGVSRMWWHLPREAVATASADGRTLEGTWSAPPQNGNVETWTWKLEYVGPP